MSDPTELLPLTSQMQEAAREQQIHGTVHSAEMMVGLGNALSVAALVAPKTARVLGHNLLSFDVAPLKPGKVPIRPGPLFEWYALPPPLGIAPPELYGASPTYLGDQFPFLPKTPFLATSTTPERAAVHAAQRQREQLENEVLAFVQHTTREQRLARLGEVQALPAEARRAGSVLEFQTRILERELTFQNVPHAVTVFAPVTVVPVTSGPSAIVLPEQIRGLIGGFDPLQVRPGNSAAIANANAAKGIDRELIHERADP